MRCSQSASADRSGETGHRGNKLQLIPVHLLSHHCHNGAGVVLLTTFRVKNYSTAARLCQPSTTEECSSPQARCPSPSNNTVSIRPSPSRVLFEFSPTTVILLPFVYEVTIIIPGNTVTRLDPNSIQFRQDSPRSLDLSSSGLDFPFPSVYTLQIINRQLLCYHRARWPPATAYELNNPQPEVAPRLSISQT